MNCILNNQGIAFSIFILDSIKKMRVSYKTMFSLVEESCYFKKNLTCVVLSVDFAIVLCLLISKDLFYQAK